ncbi:hypothetical protein GCM10009847_18370 [Leucobacter tardus]|uniref:Uncharacterized protein n=1 Tax=Leucobacter tardus TaxID=501483 RepID=A0A939QEG9_9MICO|nr:hypothetical protein [Leucobacter tardus]MBO2990650.1 hypothetical protein [Leucobacter tardus]
MHLIVIGIIACEIGFWVVLGLGLATRYLLRMRRTSTVLLLCVPILDVALLTLIAWDLLANRAVADFSHGLGAVYLGFTIAFGHQIVTRVDAWFAHRFADGPEPWRPPKSGAAQVRYEWQQWARMLLCAIIASVVLGGITLIVGDPDRTAELLGWIARVWIVTGVWLLGWPVWLTVKHAGSPAAKADSRETTS